MPAIFDEIKKLKLSGNSEAVGADGPDSYPSCSVRFMDLRSHIDFESCHVTSAYSSPLPKLTAETKSPFDFGDPDALTNQWNELQLMLADPAVSQWLFTVKTPLILLCYNGNTSRIMTAILRARGLEAYSFMDGMPGIIKYLNSQRPRSLDS